MNGVCCELCVRSYIYSVALVVVGGYLVGAATGTNSGVHRYLSSNLGGGLMLRGTSVVPILPTWGGKGTRSQFLSCISVSSLCCS